MDVLFLGINDVGFRVYEWLCERETVDVLALVTTGAQLSLVERLDPDILVSVGFGQRVPPSVLETPPDGAVNLHPSYLPYNRGTSPNVWSIVDGTPAGATLHVMDREFDTGEIIARREVETSFADTGKRLHRRLERAQYELFTETWPSIEAGGFETTAQRSDEGTSHSTADFRGLCEIDPDEEVVAGEFLDRLRALTFPPFDNAYVEVDGERYYVDVDVRHADEAEDEAEDGLISSY